MSRQVESNRVQTIVIGGGQAGLSVGYFLAKRGMQFLILDANARVGDAWRELRAALPIAGAEWDAGRKRRGIRKWFRGDHERNAL